MSEWIKCIDRLPADKRDVQVYCDDTDEQMVGFHIGNGRFQYAFGRSGESIVCTPSHWMHLIEGPK